MPNGTETISSLAARIKEKYPVYAEVNDAELVSRVTTKYPQYAVQLTERDNTAVGAWQKSQEYAQQAEASKPQGSPTSRFLKQAGGTVVDTVKGLANTAEAFNRTIRDPREAIKFGRQMLSSINQGDAARKEAGRSSPYRAVAGVGTAMGLDPSRMEQAAERGDTAGVLGAASGQAAMVASPYIAKGIAKSIPSTARAGRTFETVKAAAGNVPIDISGPGNVALRIDQLAQSGGTMPKVIRNFIQRASDPSKSPLTYAEARDFYSNASRLSASEFQRLTPVLRREVVRFTVELKASLEGATQKVGQAENFRKAMTEYRRAAKGKEMIKKVSGPIAKGAAAALGGAAAYGLYKKVYQ